MEKFDYSSLIILVLIGLAVFLILREFWCWYYKINTMVRLQRSILETLLKMYEQNGGAINWDAVKEILGKK